MSDFSDFDGILDVQILRLRELGIESLQSLQKATSDPSGREVIARKSGLNTQQILRWLNRRDLFRIRGMNHEYLELLERAEVASMGKLALCDADQLNNSLIKLSEKNHRNGRLPGLLKVLNWVAQAKHLPAMVL